MNNPNEPYGSHWLKQLETLDEIKEEPFDDMMDMKQEDLIHYFSDYVKDEIEDIKEGFEDFPDFKEEDPIIDGINAIGNKSVEIKEEFADDFVDVKEEELSTLPIADMYCPSTGNSRPLIIDFGKEMHSQNVDQVFPLPALMKATKTIKVNGSVRVTQDAVIKLHRNGPNIGPSAAVSTTFAPIAPKLTRVARDGSSNIDCTICKVLRPNGQAMYNHIRSMHPERSLQSVMGRVDTSATAAVLVPLYRLSRPLKCAFCNVLNATDAGMENHMRSMHPEELVKIGKLRLLKKSADSDSVHRIGNEMANHLQSRHPERKCGFCMSFHVVGDPMYQHMRSMHPEELEEIRQRESVKKCSFCDSFYKIGRDMIEHLRSKHPEIVTKKCAFCDSSHSMGFEMEIHVRSMHPEKEQRECSYCEALTKRSDEMVIHVISMHRGEWEKIMQKLELNKCNFCNSFYTKGDEMKKHVALQHPRARMCDLCTSFHVIGAPMRKHMRSMHPERCVESVQQMMYTMCSFCDNYYKRGSGMTRHIRTMHPGRRSPSAQSDANLEISGPPELTKDNGLPISAGEIAEMSHPDFLKLIYAGPFTASQRELSWKIRLRGQKTASARKISQRPKLARTEQGKNAEALD